MLVERSHGVNRISKVESVMKMTARNTYQQMRQGVYESIYSYKERFTVAHKAYLDFGNAKIEEENIAMDFFRGLSNVH